MYSLMTGLLFLSNNVFGHSHHDMDSYYSYNYMANNAYGNNAYGNNLQPPPMAMMGYNYNDNNNNNNNDIEKYNEFMLRSELISIYGLFWEIISDGWETGSNADFAAIAPTILTTDFRFKSNYVSVGEWFESRDDFVDTYIDAVIADICDGDSCDTVVSSMSSGFVIKREASGLVSMTIGISNYINSGSNEVEEFEKRKVTFRNCGGSWKMSQDENIGSSLS